MSFQTREWIGVGEVVGEASIERELVISFDLLVWIQGKRKEREWANDCNVLGMPFMNICRKYVFPFQFVITTCGTEVFDTCPV